MHNDDVFLIVITVIAFTIAGFMIGNQFGYVDATKRKMKEAFDRGYAVQCIGKESYYWECEE